MTDKILLIVIDQFRADCLAGGLADAAPLPHLQALMEDATSFDRHYTVTTPCGPSRASLLTGLYAMNHRSIRNGTPLAKQHLTIAQHLRKAGVEPMLFGYTDVSADPTDLHENDPALRNYEGLAPGFEEIVRLRFELPGSWIGYLKSKGYQVPPNYWDLYKPALDRATASEQFPEGSPIRSKALYSAEDSDTAYLTNRTIEELSVRESADWFAMLTYIRPHPPLVAPSPFNTMFSPASMPTAHRTNSIEELKASHPFFNACFSAPSNFGLYQGFDGDIANITDYQLAEMRAVYSGLAFEVDQHIGRVINYLKGSGQYDNTLIVVTADHGEMLGDQRLWGKTCPFDPALHIPLIIRDPRQPKSFGQRISSFTESIDIAPTLLDWVKTDPANKDFGRFNGRSLLPLVAGETPPHWRKHIFSESELGDLEQPTLFQKETGLAAVQASFAVLRSESSKYVHFNGGLPPLLYDLEEDPKELQNLAADTTAIEQLLRHSSLMLNHRMTHANYALSNKKITEKGLIG